MRPLWEKLFEIAHFISKDRSCKQQIISVSRLHACFHCMRNSYAGVSARWWLNHSKWRTFYFSPCKGKKDFHSLVVYLGEKWLKHPSSVSSCQAGKKGWKEKERGSKAILIRVCKSGDRICPPHLHRNSVTHLHRLANSQHNALPVQKRCWVIWYSAGAEWDDDDVRREKISAKTDVVVKRCSKTERVLHDGLVNDFAVRTHEYGFIPFAVRIVVDKIYPHG